MVTSSNSSKTSPVKAVPAAISAQGPAAAKSPGKLLFPSLAWVQPVSFSLSCSFLQ